MDPLALVLTILLVIIFVVLIVGATGYYDNSTIASPLPLRESQIDPENELDLYVIYSTNGLTRENVIYNYKNTVVTFGYITSEFNYARASPTSTTYIHSNVSVSTNYFTIASALSAEVVKVYINGVTIGILSLVRDSYSPYIYSMIKQFESSLPSSDTQWILIYSTNINLDNYNTEFKILPTILDPTTNEPFVYGIISSLNFNYNISVETILNNDKGLRIRMRSDNRIQSMYPETTTNPSVVEQNTTEVVGTASASNVNAKHSQDIISLLFP